MPYDLVVNGSIAATMDPHSGQLNYDPVHLKEIVAGQAQSKMTGAGLFQTVKVVYRFDKDRYKNNETLYSLYKNNPVLKNRVAQLNSLVFGRGLTYMYEDAKIKETIDNFWNMNRIKSKLNGIGTDAQVYGETFISLWPQENGTVIMTVYESNQVQIDFAPDNVDDVQKYIVAWKDETTNKNESIEFQPLSKFLNEIEFQTTTQRAVGKVKRMLGGGKKNPNVMLHIKFNNTSSEVHGTSDFRQVYTILNKYMDFRDDRLAIHQFYGSPAFDISIDTSDSDVIDKRIEELSSFILGANPVHNAKETWKPLEFKMPSDSAEFDENAMRGMICAGLDFPEHMLFNQSRRNDSGGESGEGTLALHKLAEGRQDAFEEAFKDIHKFVVYVAGGDITKVNTGKIIFPIVSTMSEKTMAETYQLHVGAGIVSRKTAAIRTGHNWDEEEAQILAEKELFGDPQENPDVAGRMGGATTNKLNAGKEGSDDGDRNKKNRLVRSGRKQVMNSDKNKD